MTTETDSETIVVRGDGVTLDLILWRRFGRAGADLLDETVELNRALALAGPILPLGAIVRLPAQKQAGGVSRAPVSLFD